MGKENKLLVIGNGFDLTVGIKTKFSDYFNSNYYKETREVINQLIVIFEKTREIEGENIDINCWDLLFYLESHDSMQKTIPLDEMRWCDVERVIHNSLTTPISNNKNAGFSWSRIYQIIRRYYSDYMSKYSFITSDTDIIRIMSKYITNCCSTEIVNSERKFYTWLLSELNKFEISFGQYILEQTSKDEYLYKAQECAGILTNTNEEGIQIDSFNYSDFKNGSINLRHVNGDTAHPIFGIDLSPDEEEKNSEIRRFTKTSRRVYQDVYRLNQETNWDTCSITRAIVYGHSLNDMDYDYFNYLFTKLKFNTFEVERMGSIEFIYRIYDETNADSIRNDYANAVYKLLNYYENYFSSQSQHILINLLRFSGKLVIREFRE